MSDEEFQGLVDQYLNSAHFSHLKTRIDKLGFVFQHIDKDGSMSLTHDELVRLAMKIDPMASEDKIQNSMNFLDKDGSGEVYVPPSRVEI